MKMAKRNSRRVKSSRLQLLLIPALGLLMAVAVFLVLNFINTETQMELKEPVYQYFIDQRVDYEAGTKLLPGEYHVLFERDGERSAGTDTPIYSAEDKALILPKDMSWTDPATGVEWRVPMFSRIEADDNGTIWCQLKNKKVNMNGGILNNGTGSYLFLDTVTLMINDREYTLPPLSFCSTADGDPRIYAYGDEELLKVGERKTNIVVASVGRSYRVDLTRGIYTSAEGSNWLLSASPKALKALGS